MELKTQVHNIPPLYDEKSRVLILGSFPSVKSREAAFFYAHPQPSAMKYSTASRFSRDTEGRGPPLFSAPSVYTMVLS